jgi:hypothetical protein
MADQKKPDPYVAAQEKLDAESGERTVFYHPGRKCNCLCAGDGEVQEQGVPKGYELDVERWEKDGKKGAAFLRKIKPVEPTVETQDGTAPKK